MGWSYGDWSRILIHGISSSTLCSEQTLGVFHYNTSDFFHSTRTDKNSSTKFYASVRCKLGPFWQRKLKYEGCSLFFQRNIQYRGRLRGHLSVFSRPCDTFFR